MGGPPDFSPIEIVELIDFRYLTDMLATRRGLGPPGAASSGRMGTGATVVEPGLPAYTTSAAGSGTQTTRSSGW